MRQLKGFTLVELAIVLVIIGLILGMAIKGKQLIHTARVMAEVQKVRKFEVAFSIFASRTNSIKPPPPRAPGQAQFDLSVFVNMGLLTERDFDYGLLDDDTQWDFGNCRKGATGMWETSGTDFCIQPTNGGRASAVETRAFHLEVVCQIEQVFDDTNAHTGNGTWNEAERWQYGEKISRDFTPAEYADCQSLWPRVGGNYLYSISTISYTPL